jgi:hypothetical protein
MKQLYYTSCASGKSLGGSRGFQVRAASADISPIRLRSVVSLVGYKLPAGVPPDVDPSATPVRLALLETPDTGRMLCHSVYARQDPDTGRFGNFFSHVVLDLPASYDAGKAAEAWGSSFWQRSDDDGGTGLPDLDELPLPGLGAPSDAGLRQALARTEGRALVEFVLASVLAAVSTTRRVFLVAAPEEVAMAVFGLSRALPVGSLDGFTFSTYESEPLTCPARLVTCWWPPDLSPLRDLPTVCYKGGDAVAFNTQSGRASPVFVPRYVGFALGELAGGRGEALASFLNVCSGIGVTEPSLVELLYRIDQLEGAFTKEEGLAAMEDEGFGRRIAARPEVRSHLSEWSIEDPSYGLQALPKLAVVAPDRAAFAEEQANKILAAAVATLGVSDVGRAETLLDRLLPAIAPEKAARAWSSLRSEIADPGRLTWEARARILPRVLDGEIPSNEYASVDRWLKVPTDRLAALLALPLSAPLIRKACVLAFNQPGVIAQPAIQAIASNPRLRVEVLADVAASKDGDDRVAAVFGALARTVGPENAIGDLISQKESYLPALLDRLIDAALAVDEVDAIRLVRSLGKALVDLTSTGPTIWPGRLATLLLADEAAAVLDHKHVREFLVTLGKTPEPGGFNRATRRRVHAWLALERYLHSPDLSSENLRELAFALSDRQSMDRTGPHSELGNRVLATVAKMIERLEPKEVGEAVERVLATLGLAPGGPMSWYEGLARHWMAGRSFWKRPDLVDVLLAIGFGTKSNSEIAASVARELAESLHRRGGRAALEEACKRSLNWSDPAASEDLARVATKIEPKLKLLTKPASEPAGITFLDETGKPDGSRPPESTVPIAKPVEQRGVWGAVRKLFNLPVFLILTGLGL